MTAGEPRRERGAAARPDRLTGRASVPPATRPVRGPVTGPPDPSARHGHREQLRMRHVDPNPPRREPAKIDIDVAHYARVYDYLLGGTDNFAVDREAAKRQAAAIGGLDVARAAVRAQRAFMGRVVHHLVTAAGIRQFLDLGTGIPTARNVHEVAQELAPAARVVYVDNDPIVLAHAHTLLSSDPAGATAYVDADLRDAAAVLEAASRTLDLTQPVAVMLVAVLHLFDDGEDPHGVVAKLLDPLPAGSYLAVSHLAKDLYPEAIAAMVRSTPRDAGYRLVMRTRDEVTRFFDGLDLVAPGVVRVDWWRPDRPEDACLNKVAIYGALGRKP
jgi:hypothetical protein